MRADPREGGGRCDPCEKGLGKTEIISFHDLIAVGKEAAANAKEKIGLEDKEHVVQEYDVAEDGFPF